MTKRLADELADGLRDAVAHLRGEINLPPEQIHFAGEPDPREVRARANMTQEQFAGALGISVHALAEWEQGRRDPEHPAMRLLEAAAKNPDVLRNAAA
ncbi:MAG TPA: helix-turn-helix domain-containing protein [Longimicrobium sp.]|jgi:putative transcriptional regulator|uniref:helix-turn-helix domain-containing protein n=1 Tax=Longimicrobium sp. TaxID=2029185 RepID=UPI002EDA61F3